MNSAVKKVFETELEHESSAMLIRNKHYLEGGYQAWATECFGGAQSAERHMSFLCGAIYVLSALSRMTDMGMDGALTSLEVFDDMVDEADKIRTMIFDAKPEATDAQPQSA